MGRLPAAERVVGDGHGNGHVHAHHADLDAAGKIARGVAVAGEDGGAVGHLVGVHQIDRVVEALGAHDRQDGAEDLLAPDRHVRRHPVEQAAADVEPVLVALHGEAAPVHDELGALLDPLVDIAFDARLRLRRHDGAEIGFVVGGRADAQRLEDCPDPWPGSARAPSSAVRRRAGRRRAVRTPCRRPPGLEACRARQCRRRACRCPARPGTGWRRSRRGRRRRSPKAGRIRCLGRRRPRHGRPIRGRPGGRRRRRTCSARRSCGRSRARG